MVAKSEDYSLLGELIKLEVSVSMYGSYKLFLYLKVG